MQKIMIPIGVDLANFRPVNTFVSLEKLAGKEMIRITKDPKIEAVDEPTFARIVGCRSYESNASDGGRMMALSTIRQIDYTIIYTRDMAAMRHFYETVLGFRLLRELSPRWVEYQVGSNTLALTVRGGRFADPSPPTGALSLQLAFRVAPSMVDACAQELAAAGVTIVFPPTDQPFGHRTLFFRDPDGNVLEIYAEI